MCPACPTRYDLPISDRPFVLGVDLDGVCGDHTGIFREIVAEVKGVPIESLPLERQWSFVEWGLSPEEFEELHEIAVVEHRMFRDMPVMDGVAECLWRLSDEGVWIRIISHRLYVNWGHAIAAGDTAAWLDQARIPYRDLCFIGAKSAIDADAYVEDGPHNIEAFHADGRDVIIYDQPYNRHLTGTRASTWAEVEEMVLERLAQHRGVAQPQLPGVDAGADRLDRRRGETGE
ncbi:MAG: 5' nucleotidase, NT5C type [Acidimicrobiales bacterium]